MKRIYAISDSNGYHNVGEQIINYINFDPGDGEFTQEFIYTDFLGVEKKDNCYNKRTIIFLRRPSPRIRNKIKIYC